MAPNKNKNEPQLFYPEGSPTVPEPTTTPIDYSKIVVPKRPIKRRVLIIIVLTLLAILYFSGLLGFGFYAVKCGGIPATYTNFAAADSYHYFGDLDYLISMPFTSIGWDEYRCTDASPIPSVRAAANAKAEHEAAAAKELQKETALNGIKFQLYEVKNGAIPRVQKGRFSSIHGTTFTQDYQANGQLLELTQREKVFSIADERLCADDLKAHISRPDDNTGYPSCGHLTPKGQRVYDESVLPESYQIQASVAVVDIGNTQILINRDPFSYQVPSKDHKSATITVDDTKLDQFVDQLTPLDGTAKKKLLSNLINY